MIHDKLRDVIGDIIHYFTSMSSKLTLFALFFIFRHHSLFFQKYENNVIVSLQFSKTFEYFQKFICETQFFCRNLIPDMMETFLDGPPHSKCLENAKNDGGRNAGSSMKLAAKYDVSEI